MDISLGSLFIITSLVIINGTLGFLVITRNSKATLNRLFLLMTMGITLWVTSSAISDNTANYDLARYTSFLAFGASFFAISCAYLFSYVFRFGRLKRYHLFIFIFCVILSFLYATPLVYDLGATIDTYTNGVLYGPYLVSMVTALGLILYNFGKVARHGNHLQKNHARLIFAGFAGMTISALITNAILPAIIDITWTTNLGPLFTVLFVVSVAYSIVRHHMFDLRLAVARGMAYVLTAGVVGGFYLVLISIVSQLFLGGLTVGLQYQLVTVSIAILSGLTFYPLKRVFDHFTNHIFYRDAYEPQQFIDELNQLLVSSIDLGPLLKASAEIIERNLKADFCYFMIRKTSYFPRRIMGNKSQSIADKALDEITEAAPKVREKVIVADYLEDGQKDLADTLVSNNVTVLIHLTPTVANNKEGLGYIFIGPKKSGNLYSNQDIKILEIITNELIIAIQNALRFEEIENFNVTLQEKVNVATRQLRQTNEKLRALDETKDEFISMASHQLRTPLTSVKGYLSMVIEGDTGKVKPDQAKLLNQAFISAQRMVYLIADLLNVSRLKTGKFIIETAPSNLADVIEGEISQLTETAKGRNLELIYDKPKDFPILMLDETKIRQVIMNFIDNAIYYTPAGGHIEVKLVDNPDTVEFMVVDDGLGVPKADQHHLFSKFYRAGNAKKARPDGTGLGLFMAKKVIVAQGGAIIFKSQEGKGSTFGFSFAKSQLQKASKTSAPAKKESETTPVSKTS